MDSYIDITIRQDPEFLPTQLMTVLYGKLHLRLVSLSESRVGVSFPRINEEIPSIGQTLRLHGSSSSLASLMDGPWLTGMRDHVAISAVAEVPRTAQHRCIKRVQAKSGVDRLRRRLMKRHQLNEEQARERIPDTVAEQLTLPYVQLSSASTGQKFRLFLAHGPIELKAQAGSFNSYGLSQGATVPWF